jgi:hypothetical protein
MKLTIRFVIPALFLAVGGVALAHPRILTEVGLDLWSASAQSDENHWRAEDARIDTNIRHADQRSRIKESLAQDLIDGRISLADAADQFMALNEVAPAIVGSMRQSFPASSDRESAALQVVSYVKVRLRDETDLSEKVLQRLGDELRTLRSLPAEPN